MTVVKSGGSGGKYFKKGWVKEKMRLLKIKEADISNFKIYCARERT